MFTRPNQKLSALKGLGYALMAGVLIHLSTPGVLELYGLA